MANENLTKIADMIDPEVMADMVSAKVPRKIRVSPFAKVDNTLVGVPGDTITVPVWGYIGDAADVAEGEGVTPSKMSSSKTTAKIKKAMKAVPLSDEALLSGYGNPAGEATNQLALAIASKIDNDCMDAVQGATLKYDGSAAIISYNGIVDAIDMFEEEVNTEKVMFVHPKQVTQLRKDENFISSDKYPGNVMMSGEIGMIANTRIVPSKKVPKKQVSTIDCYHCPIIKLEQDTETEDETPALTIYLKRDTNLETERHTLTRTTDISVDKVYTAVLSNQAKVVLAQFAAVPAVEPPDSGGESAKAAKAKA